ncbi:MAG: sulfite exporter TauE/SafE family protein [Deltaproteobacteria bacterium]
MEHAAVTSAVSDKKEQEKKEKGEVKRRGIFTRMAISVPELTILILLLVGGYTIMAVFSKVQGTQVLSPFSMWLIIVGSFLISTAIAIIAVIAGIGGGVIFTPIMLGFTSMDSLVIRATGLVVAMFGGLISSGPFMKSRLANLRVVFFCGVPITIGALIGSVCAIYLHDALGAVGDGLVRLSLGALMLVIAWFLFTGGGKTEYPEPEHIDPLSGKLGLNGSYWESSLGKVVEYRLVRALPGALIFIFLGFVGGFFGMGGGAFLTATLNLVMMAPVKIAAACSGVLLAISDATAIWTYITYGALVAILAAPWMLGHVVGGILGAHLLIRIRAGFVRKILIFILILSSVKLIARGIEGAFGIHIPLIG